MKSHCRWILFFILFWPGLSLQAEERVFPAPESGGYRVDICLTWAQRCGQEAADVYCRQQGFDHAAGFEIAEDVGAATPSRTLIGLEVCDQAFCDAFASITCQRAGGESIIPGAPRTGPPPAGRTRVPVEPTLTPAPAPTPTPAPAPTPAPTQPAGPSGDPDEFVVLFGESSQALLGRFGSKAAAGQLEESGPVTLSIRSDFFQADTGDFDADGQADLALLEHLKPLEPGSVEISWLTYRSAQGFKPLAPPLRLEFASSVPMLLVAPLLQAGRVNALVYAPGGAASVLDHELGLLVVAWNPRGVLVPIDVNGDGLAELLDYAEPGGTLDLVTLELGPPEAGGQRRLSPVLRPLPTPGPGRQFAAGDFNGDGREELLIHDTATGAVTMYAFSPVGSLMGQRPVDTGWTADALWTHGHDYDGDGRDDLLVARPVAQEVVLVRFTSTGDLRDKRRVSNMHPESLLFPGYFTGTSKASYVAMARAMGNRLVHVRFDADGIGSPDGVLIEQLPDGGILQAGNFVRDP